jgi:hypothetical protein
MDARAAITGVNVMKNPIVDPKPTAAATIGLTNIDSITATWLPSVALKGGITICR